MNILKLSGKLDAQSIAIYQAVDHADKKLNIPYVVVGAAARDLVLHYGYGARLQRATQDIDIAVQVNDWQAFEKLRTELLTMGFQQDKIQHRLKYKNMIIDLLPCGAIEDGNANIAWPPDGAVVMNMLGFHEAINHAVMVILQDRPALDVPVVTPAALSLLKLVSWSDREANLKNKDAKDLLFLFKTYEEIPEVRDWIFEHSDIREKLDWNIERSSAYKLGVDAANIATEQTRAHLAKIKNNLINKRTYDALIEDMCGNIERDFENNSQLLDAYFQGFAGHHCT